jgi:hypothetical protein
MARREPDQDQAPGSGRAPPAPGRSSAAPSSAKRTLPTHELDQFLTRGHHAEREPAEGQQLLERALQLYRGAPLAGADYLWIDSDIRHLKARLVDPLRRAGQA